MPRKIEDLEESTGPVKLYELMQDGMAYDIFELYELLYKKSIELSLKDYERGGAKSEEMGELLANLSLFTLDMSSLSYKIYREFEEGHLGVGVKNDIRYYYKK